MKLSKTNTAPKKSINEESLKLRTTEMIKEIGEYQSKLFAESKKSLLVILQGMDAAGKDGAIRKVFAEVNPNGCHVISFSKPTELEYSHDFLWRIHQKVPPFGQIHIFNRSHYEDILVPSVEGYIPEKIISARYQQINDFESMLEANGIMILKFFLHISKDEQKKRLSERMIDPKKFWKHKDADWETRKKWDRFLEVYDSIFAKCNSVPWHIIPSDKNWYKEYLISEATLKILKEMDPKFPGLVTSMKK